MKKRNTLENMRPAYRYWILDCLARQTDGRADVQEVYRHVARNLGSHFIQREKTDVPSGGEPTWRIDVRQERRDMIRYSLLAKASERGIWEITDAGREWLMRNPNAGTPGFNMDEFGL